VAPLALAATGGALENRVRRILGLPRHQDRGARAWGAAWLGLAVLSLSAAGTSVTRAAAPQAASRPDGPAASRLDAADSSQDLMLKGDVVIRSDDRVIRTDFATLRLVPAEPGGQQAQAGATGQADTEEQTRQAQEEIQMALQGLSRQTEEIRRQIDEARRSLEEARRQLEQARVGQVEAIGRQLEASRAAADPGEPDIRPLFDLEALRRQIEQLGVAPGGRLGGVRSPLPVGLLQNGRYHHNRTGIEFDVPAEWSFLSDGPSSDGGDMARVRDSASDVILSAWMNRDDTPSRPAADRLRYVVGMKIRQRYDQGYRDYWVSPETIVEKMVGGRPALSAVGTYVSNGQTMAEYLIWVDGEATQAFFFTSVAASDLAALQSRFDQIVESAVVP
jgi:hypothetical protein